MAAAAPAHDYAGSGTEEDPFLVTFDHDDPGNPQNMPRWKKWTILVIMAIATLSVAFCSSAYTGGIPDLITDLHASTTLASAGISLFVLGFAIGPLFWAPLSETFGRRILYFITFGALTAFNAGGAGAHNITTVIVLRFFAGSFGSSPLVNCGGVIADTFSPQERGLAIAIFSAMPFFGPVLGPIVGGFVGESLGFRWIQGLMAIFTGIFWIIGTVFVPETYAPVLLRWRAQKLQKATGECYMSPLDASTRTQSQAKRWRTVIFRPFILLFCEPIVLAMSIYLAIVYGSLYLTFAAFPIVYQEYRGWSEGIGGLSFIGIAVGMIFALILNFFDNQRYVRVCNRSPGGMAPPETRLPVSMIAAVAIPIGLFWFAWTNGPEIPWIVSIIATAPFGFGLVLVFLSLSSYLIDSYTIYAASVLAATSLLRSLFGAAFPLFTTAMYDNLGIHWASSVPAFLLLACVPFPFLFYKFGPFIRSKCKYAAAAAEKMKMMARQTKEETPTQEDSDQKESV